MKKGEIYSGVVTKYSFPNKGIIESDGIKITVKNAILGQKVSYRLQKKRNDSGQGRLLSVDEASPLETCEAFCPHFGICGSCLYQRMPYENQRDLKKQIVMDLLCDVKEDYIFDGIKESPQKMGYRNKMEFTFGDEEKGGKMTLGLHKRGSFYDILDASVCKLVDSDYGNILSTVVNYCRENKLPYFHKITHDGYLRHLIIRRSEYSGELLVDLVTTSQINHDFSRLVDEILALELNGSIAGFLHTTNDSAADAVIDEGTICLYGKDFIEEELLGLRFKISPFSFFQTNSRGAEVLYNVVRDYISEFTSGKIVYDLYSGTGTIAQLLAPAAKKVIGVEIVEEAVEAAKMNAKLNGLDNCSFIAGDVLKVLDEIQEKPDVIVLDPPRDGIHPKAITKILGYGVKNIVYISCKPTSLARDLEVCREYGYEVKRVGMVDMFPWTVHVETVVMLSHKKPDSVINVKVEFGEGEGKVPLDNIAKRAAAYKPKERVTYKMIKEYIEAKYGFKVHTAYIAEVKRDLGLPMYDAPNAVEELKQPRKHPTVEKVEAIKDALKYFGII